mgnify:CR=1 FL=1
MTGAYLATQKSRNLGVTFGKGTTQNLTFSKFTDFDKQIVYIGVIDLAECYSFTAILTIFVKKLVIILTN